MTDTCFQDEVFFISGHLIGGGGGGGGVSQRVILMQIKKLYGCSKQWHKQKCHLKFI